LGRSKRKSTFSSPGKNLLGKEHVNATGSGFPVAEIVVGGFRLSNVTNAPEVDPKSGALPAALAMGSLLLMSDRRKKEAEQRPLKAWAEPTHNLPNCLSLWRRPLRAEA
jgi:hypothetical protein